jgi:hypothetical protein
LALRFDNRSHFLAALPKLFEIVDFVPTFQLLRNPLFRIRAWSDPTSAEQSDLFLLFGIKLDRAGRDGATELEIGADDPIKCVDPKLEKCFALAAVHRFPMFGHQVAGLAIIIANVLLGRAES